MERIVSERTQELCQLNQTLRMMSQCNQALVKGANERDLIQTICKIIHNTGCYTAVWVGFAIEDSFKTIQPVAMSGRQLNFLIRRKVSWGDNRYGQGSSGTAIRTGQCSTKTYKDTTDLKPWFSSVIRLKYQAAISLPLIDKGHVFGVLTLYSTDLNAFSVDQTKLLKELADSLAYGIVALRARAERDAALKILEQKNSQLRVLASQLTTAEERERRRLAITLHDDLQQQLVGARYNIQYLQSLGKSRLFKKTVRRVDKMLSQCLDNSRLLTAELSPRVLYEVGLGPALKWLGHQYEIKHGITVNVQTNSMIGLNENLAITIFQAVRELLFNVLKHARVKTAQVRANLSSAGIVRVVVSDNGVGFDPSRLNTIGSTSGGFGLFSLRERLASFGGKLSIKSAPGKGNCVTIHLPLQSSRLRKMPLPHFH